MARVLGYGGIANTNGARNFNRGAIVSTSPDSDFVGSGQPFNNGIRRRNRQLLRWTVFLIGLLRGIFNASTT